MNRCIKSVCIKSVHTMTTTFTRSLQSKYKFGAHVSGAGGISNCVQNAHRIGCNAFAMFLKSPRKWISPQYTQEEVDKFKDNCKKLGYDPLTDILPHGQYFINLANPDKEKADKSYTSFIDDLQRCEQLGIGLYNFHPGSSLTGNHEKQLVQLAEYLNRAIKETKFVRILLENMAGTGNLVGSDLLDLHKVIELIEDKSRIGVCIDTCHTFAAGYDICTKESYEKFWENFKDIVGYKYLGAIHLNDSKAPLGANRDLHEKLGQGFLTLEVFHMIAHDERIRNIPIILETPHSADIGYGEEINLLEWLETVPAVDQEEFVAKNEALQKEGANSRADQLKKFDAKQKKTAKASLKRKKADSADSEDIMAKLAKKSKQ